jgi:mannose-6-phosphate isomerase-like protein (cupin superfamily)
MTSSPLSPAGAPTGPTTASGGAVAAGSGPASAVGAGGMQDSTASSRPWSRVNRPWGWFETLVAASPAHAVGSGYGVKRLWIDPNARISLQRHLHRSEHWVVVAGSGLLECGEEATAAQPGASLVVPVGAIHRASAGAEGLLIIEVQRGDQLREDDIERLADDYGRVVRSTDSL